MDGSRLFRTVLGLFGALILLAAVATLVVALRLLFVKEGPGPWPTGPVPTLVAQTKTTVPTSSPTAAPSATTEVLPSATSPVEPSATTVLPPTPRLPSATPPATATQALPPSSPTPTATRTQAPPTATSTPNPTPYPTVTITDWKGEYFANPALTGPVRLIRNDQAVDFTLAPGTAPAPNMPSENWSARWSRSLALKETNYRFRIAVDDGARLWVGDRLLIDAWSDGPAREYVGDRYLAGDVPIRLEYYNHLGTARVRLTWDRMPPIAGWTGSYFGVPDLSGLPFFQRDDATLQFDWGTGSPRPDLPADDFSVRWTRRVAFARPGQYRFRVTADDGVRLWVDGRLLIDAWQDGLWAKEALMTLQAGNHDVRLDYFEHLGAARVQLGWELVPVPPTATSTATATPPHTPTPPPTNTPTSTPIPIETQAPPTDTPVPTSTPVPVRPAITLEPTAGPIGLPFDALGRGWPANTLVELFLVRPVPKPAPMDPVAQVTSDGSGTFTVELRVPPDEGWEGMKSATVLARTQDGRYRANASYQILPALSKIRSQTIPTDEQRFEQAAPGFPVLDSETAWAEWFGAAPPPARPPVDWAREIVLGAFLGPQPADGKLAVDRIVQRDRTVSVWLSVAVPPRNAISEGRTGRLRVLVRVQRSALQPAVSNLPGDLVFAFLDASGRLLAQGPPGAVKPVPAPSSEVEVPAELILEAAAAAPEEGVAGAGDVTTTQAPVRALAAAAPAEAEAPAAALRSGEVAAEEPFEAAATQIPATWVGLGVGAFLLTGWGVGVAVNRRANRLR